MRKTKEVIARIALFTLIVNTPCWGAGGELDVFSNSIDRKDSLHWSHNVQFTKGTLFQDGCLQRMVYTGD